MNDFRRQQFVIVDGVLKLSDVDDIGKLILLSSTISYKNEWNIYQIK
jgi:hypothetical protein